MVITEIVRIPVDAARVDEFLTTYERASAPYYACEGCLSHRLYRSDEEPGILLGVVEWESLDAHKSALTSPVGELFLQAIGPLTTEFPDVKFYEPAVAPRA
jgi:quinol monooxygenase YgiN